HHFGGWAGARGHQSGIVMAFPVEGWSASAAVVVSQGDDGMVSGTVHGSADADVAWRQALAVLSLDVDGTGYVDVGERDPIIGRLQRESAYLRPVLFHSPYEAACSFVIGHRIRITQGRAIRQRMAVAHGEAIDVDGAAAHAFPSPGCVASTHSTLRRPTRSRASLTAGGRFACGAPCWCTRQSAATAPPAPSRCANPLSRCANSLNPPVRRSPARTRTAGGTRA